ncbi:cell wall metabolism sensor histidine kinase WalK [Sporosarcina sp. P16b]|uniref:sensor histidine kinase n=1 Tax=Sporosarcina sp. P16b TaxID=2048261 RepID=UPI001E303378|nr:ATP-binding protein [Sporosarcina sp. P16b]
MSRINNYLSTLIPSGFLWRLTFLNILVIVTATAISGWAIYNTACFLVAGVGDLDGRTQQRFNSTLLNYLWIFMIAAAFVGSLLHFYLIKRLIKPIRSLIQSTEKLKLGDYPEPVQVNKQDEIGQLVTQYNGLIAQLQTNEQQRKKLVSDLSHEIRTPLSNLNGYLQALRDGDIVGDKVLFASLHQESNRLSQMIEQLEQLKEWDYLSTQSVVKKEMYEIESQLTQCVAMFDRALMQKNIPIQVEVESCKLYINIEGIQQVISNLLENAMRYYEGIGPILITGKKQGKGYCISITGPSNPIPVNEREKVFMRFYRLDSSRSRLTGGSGLGLAISKEIVERHHQGEIGIETTDNSNTFWIVLPR